MVLVGANRPSLISTCTRLAKAFTRWMRSAKSVGSVARIVTATSAIEFFKFIKPAVIFGIALKLGIKPPVNNFFGHSSADETCRQHQYVSVIIGLGSHCNLRAPSQSRSDPPHSIGRNAHSLTTAAD